jgi:hypothetical protein
MRDIIWTVIIIWLIWRIIEAFRTVSATARKAQQTDQHSDNYSQNNTYTNPNTQPKKGELKSDAGEYIDYEEIK